MLYGMTFMYGATGSLNLTAIGVAFAENGELNGAIVPAVILVLAGLGFKTSLAPFFQWTPDTYEGVPDPGDRLPLDSLQSGRFCSDGAARLLPAFGFLQQRTPGSPCWVGSVCPPCLPGT
jgi:hypothetical protein